MTPRAIRIWQRLAVALAILLPLLAIGTRAEAHGFGQRFDLPLPLWLWVTGAGASIVLSFVVTAIFIRETPAASGYPSIDLLRYRAVRWLAGPLVVALFRIAGVFVFVLSVTAGFLGAQDSYDNLIVTMIWVIWWVGVAFVCALVGNLWQLINPLSTIYAALQWLVRKATGWPLTLRLAYPRWLGKWPAFLFYLGFAWLELASAVSDIPMAVAHATLNYSIITFIGMFLFGRRTWLENGEAFTIAFGVLQRFAPLHVCEEGGQRRFELRPYGAGLKDSSGVTVSLYGFVLLMLSTVTFDGFLETPLFRDLATAVYANPAIDRVLFMISDYGPTERQSLMTVLLVLFPLAFMLIFWLTSTLMVWITRRTGYPDGSAPTIGGGRAALAFVLTLVPIAVAYHLAHYFTFLFTTGQYIIPLMSDPFGTGADYLGTAGYKVNLTLLSPYFYWYASVVIIIIGHVIAVYLAHVMAFKLFLTRRAALISQLPMVILMVLYTSLSLWILAQPIVE
jgi:hypothetical protein